MLIKLHHTANSLQFKYHLCYKEIMNKTSQSKHKNKNTLAQLSSHFLLIPLYLICTLLITSRNEFINSAKAQNLESDGGYRIVDPTIDSGGNDDQSSGSGYNLFSTIGGSLNDERFESANYKLGTGQGYTIMANVPTVASFNTNDISLCGEGGCYDRARFEIDTQSNPSDTLYLVEISSDNWTTVQCLDGDTHLPKPIADKDINDYLTQGAWQAGTWSGLNILGLQSNTTYQLRIRALNGDFTESEPGPSTEARTNNPTIVFDLDIDDANGGIIQSCVSGHVDNGDGTCTATYSTPTEDGFIDGSWNNWNRDNTANEISWMNYSGHDRVGYIEWDISDLSSIRQINEAIFNYHGKNDNAIIGNITRLQTNQPSMTANSISQNQALFNEIMNSLEYVSSWNPIVDINQSINLGKNASDDIFTNLVNQDHYFAIGLNYDTVGGMLDSIYSQEYISATPEPTLEITYTKSYPNTTWPYQIDLGEITTISPTTSAEYIWIYLGTNAVNGATIAVRDANDGLYSTSTGHTITSQSEDLASADDGFGLKVDTSHLYPAAGQPGYIKPTSTYNTSGTHEVGGISTTPSTIFCSILESGGDCSTGTPTPISQGRAAIWLKAKASMAAGTGIYSDTITFTAIGTF